MTRRDQVPPGASPGASPGGRRDRFSRRRWSRRWLAWRPLLVTALLLAVVVSAVWMTYFSSVLAVRDVTVRGAHLVPVDRVRALAAVPTGEPLARVDLGAVRRRVDTLRAVAAVDVSRSWPHQVRIALTERTAIALVERDGTYHGLDAHGVLFRTFARPPHDLVVVRPGPAADHDTLVEAARVVAVLPADLARRVDHVDAASIDRISLSLRGGREVRWGSAESSGAKVRVLRVLLHHRAQVYDVTVPGQPTTLR